MLYFLLLKRYILVDTLSKMFELKIKIPYSLVYGSFGYENKGSTYWHSSKYGLSRMSERVYNILYIIYWLAGV